MDQLFLNLHELKRFNECESIIEKGLRTFVEVGNALLEIRDNRYYRQEFGTFEAYCRERWKISRFYVHRLIDAAEVATNLLPNGNIQPTHESQVRPLTALEPEEQREAWAIATQLTSNPTAEQVSQIVDTMTRAIEQARIDVTAVTALKVPQEEQADKEEAPEIDQRWVEFFGAVARLNRIDWSAAAIADAQFAITDEFSVLWTKAHDCDTAISRINEVISELEKRSSHVLR